ncbi:unnamed protein product [Moneuplotes crassus]|uniref:N6-adenine methyltransferase n=1 Tax=Euplotes crassus TaxID=5936 RepID=A0AAD1Y0Q2_EUPCR|nr:unnamed protein product [Moneuplotes crassus]
MEGSTKRPRPNMFLLKNKENGDFNQYWYSKDTIEFMKNQVEKHSKSCAFLSTPSIYFSLKDKDIKGNSKVFDYDKKFYKDPNYVFYDFNKPEDIPTDLEGVFDFVVIDPPFVTEEVWTLYATAAKYLLAEDGKILLSTIDEREEFLKETLGVDKKTFRPSIPNLVYQYSFYANYEDEEFDEANPEIPEFD